jgi:hypothetical protein
MAIFGAMRQAVRSSGCHLPVGPECSPDPQDFNHEDVNLPLVLRNGAASLRLNLWDSSRRLRVLE